MKKRILKLISLSFVVLFTACQESDNAIDAVFDGTTNGAIIRTVSLNSGEFNSYDLNSAFDVDIEVQDVENGGLLDKVDVYLQFKGSEVLTSSIPSSAFSNGPFGLPRTNIRITLSEAVAALGLSSSQYTGGDALPVRLELVLTDGRTFTDSDGSGSLQGSYFSSPYKYNTVIKCIPTSAVPGIYTIDMIDSYGDGWNGASVDVTVDGTTTSYTIDDGATASHTVTIPAGASTMSFAYTNGAWDSEASYTISYTKLDGSSPQTALSDGPSSAGGEKVLSVCQ
ncbi:MAG: hypothetical protein KIH80_003855 [Flavobacteriia bacterium]|nr:hypothetical protein [Flavobacteriia bacterium]